MMRSSRMAATLLWLAACGGSDDKPEMCTPAHGSYRVQYVEKSGDCGVGHFTAVIPIGSGDTAQCTGEDSASEDGCTAQVNVRCTDANKVVTKTVGTFHATKNDGSAFNGPAVVTLTLADGDTCSSTFDTTGNKL
jgi:hypothetical protein